MKAGHPDCVVSVIEALNFQYTFFLQSMSVSTLLESVFDLLQSR